VQIKYKKFFKEINIKLKPPDFFYKKAFFSLNTIFHPFKGAGLDGKIKIKHAHLIHLNGMNQRSNFFNALGDDY
jgi:hypothetical protein